MQLPADFLTMLNGHAAYAGLADALCTDPDVSVRVNGAKGVTVPAGADRVPWCDRGFYLPQRPPFTFDPALHQGLYYVQDASSMIMTAIASALTADGRPVRWLDACAAPGGKTTAAIDSVPRGSLVVANEYDPRRARALVENLERWGSAGAVVSQGDTAAFKKLEGFFDIVSVDAPCSGEGMMRKEPTAVTQWSPALVRQCAALQREIVANVWPSLRPGGTLVYSTCTFNRREDEENVQWINDTFGAEPVDLHLAGRHGIAGAIDSPLPVARFMPGRVRGEGLFVAVLRKPGDSSTAAIGSQAIPKSLKPVKAPGDWLNGDFVYVPAADNLYAWPKALAADMHRLQQALRVVHSGILAASVKGRDYIPSYALAHAADLNAAAFATVPVDYVTALAVLRGEPVTLPDAPRGIVMTTYGGHPLAFMKNLGNRANNLVPQSRRILSPSVPDTPPRIL